MASESSKSSCVPQKQGGKRVRATNFNSNETLKLEELVKQNFDVLHSKFTNQITNSPKAEIWKDVSRQVSALGYAYRSEQACSEKWANLKRKAKEDLTKDNLERRKTGGGTFVGASDQSVRIGEMMGTTSAFSGIEGGLDTDEQDGLNYICNNNSDMYTAQLLQDDDSYEPTVSVMSKSPDTVTNEKSSSNSPTPGVSDSCKESSSVKKPKRHFSNRLFARQQAKRSRNELLVDYQIAYFKGMVERQDLEKGFMQVKLRMLKSAEAKLNELNAREMLNLICEQ